LPEGEEIFASKFAWWFHPRYKMGWGTMEGGFMRKIWMSVLPVLALALVLNGCQAVTGETLGQNVDDTTITTTVKTKLAAEKGSSLTRVSVDTNRGVVQLTGVVTSAADRTKAEQVARGVGGVKNVVNNLQIQ
jgi:hyperosmotically inducible protein